ncbi:MAG: hypothetical protein A2504_01680 [Bdellovibrionales bacterium RIFOXYD12_FULL_39_22]|nr:MAG: hypothetical protein A2385_04205 [Bdellovibrionales bacterium RIFOXYB1_FULL_39_21]OFZ42384.1 MAG: hypothetical protein A2485_15290 [Bdellovibrionales bacterium RIFOXYC12_FULL_39_17]OFZ46315.1 MAG: hypothetical protein A2404_13725 [Bdellovibrionales bacterium RIFOXYC1_FULL_39_130]OFZ75208.1 MAG: hypothetical protein A2560_15780 [Bdellovibrionales bacterium RIFOXYD1_FULL_39_84]OFZ93202.1 MAG: hypothetical protein A2504_01680 [Bdellovibrionales bacterium RIFOXYD12_FULL_39_22]HLE11087.1 HD
MMANSLAKKLSKKFKILDKYSKLLSNEKNHTRLLELILLAVKEITHADGGTLYTPTANKSLKYEILLNSSLGLHMGGTSSTGITFRDLPIYDPLTNKENLSNIACACFLSGEIINVLDAYDSTKYNFEGTKTFDRETGYKTTSVLTIPLINLDGTVIGVIQLINAQKDNGKVEQFQSEDIAFAEFLSTHAAITLTNFQLTIEFANLFESLAKVIATAIDDKSPYTGNHCYRVPEITMMLTDAVMKTEDGPLKDLAFSEDGLVEIKMAALLHDCGKVSTPVHVIDKATKLETISDRIHLVEARFEILKRDAEIEYLKKRLANSEEGKTFNIEESKKIYQKKVARYNIDFDFLKQCNVGSEYMHKTKQARIHKIAEYQWKNGNGQLVPVLTQNEVENLTIPKGTLTKSEKDLINHHIVITERMLGQLSFPKHLKNIPAIAAAHHEKVNGTGYPHALKGDQIPVQAKILGIADIFEALTAKDRPYKKGKALSETLFILGKMVENGELDQDIFNIFMDNKIYLQYANKYLDPAQIDSVNEEIIPGYIPKSKRSATKDNVIQLPSKEKAQEDVGGENIKKVA